MAPEARDDEGKPPGLPSWRSAYALVLGVLALEVVLFSLWTWSYR